MSVELGARLDLAATDAMARRVPPPLVIERDAGGRGSASLLVLEMSGLGLGRLPPRFDYREVLYRVGVEVDREKAWLAVRCDIDRPLVRSFARAVIRYPVCPATITIDDRGDRTLTLRAHTARDHLSVTLAVEEGQDAPEPSPPRRTFVVDGPTLFEIPWDERPAPRRQTSDVVAIEGPSTGAVFGGAVTFDPRAVVHHGRVHRCGAARRVDA
ncbi:MAG: hypothetical protein U0183_16485 [Polyangiaceae bacterium]